LVRSHEEEIERMSNKNFKTMEKRDNKINELQAAIVEMEKNKNEEIHTLNRNLQSAKQEILSLQQQLQQDKEKEIEMEMANISIRKNDSQNSDKDDSQKTDKTNDTSNTDGTDGTDVTLTRTIPIDLRSPMSTTTAQRASTVIESQSSNDSQHRRRNIQIDIDMTRDESEDEHEQNNNDVMDIDENMVEDEPVMINSNHSTSSGEWWQCESCGFENEPDSVLCTICTTQNTQSQM